MNISSSVMTRKGDSFYVGSLASGCELCESGSKLVLLITGLCHHDCFYCPLSEQKSGRDVIYANERNIDSMESVLEEAELMDALGTGITGGEPILVVPRVEKYIGVLKRVFGQEHHVHLYTRSNPSMRTLQRLANAGLDEIRFHIPASLWGGDGLASSGYGSTIARSRELGMSAGVEVPGMPDKGEELLTLCQWLYDQDIDFININELEMNYINFERTSKRGYQRENEYRSAVAGSREMASWVMERMCERGMKMNIHFCTARFKDAVQLKNRIGRRARNVMRPYHELTEDNTLLYGLIECAPTDKNIRYFQKEFDVPPELMEKDLKMDCLVTAWYVVKEIWKHISFRCAVVEKYPTYDGLEVEREYLGM